jgi:hypothetical protein
VNNVIEAKHFPLWLPELGQEPASVCYCFLFTGAFGMFAFKSKGFFY